MDVVWLVGDKPDLRRLPKIGSKENSLFFIIKMATMGSILRTGKPSRREIPLYEDR